MLGIESMETRSRRVARKSKEKMKEKLMSPLSPLLSSVLIHTSMVVENANEGTDRALSGDDRVETMTDSSYSGEDDEVKFLSF